MRLLILLSCVVAWSGIGACVHLVATPDDAPPSALPLGDVQAGALAFVELGCSSCHLTQGVPATTTGPRLLLGDRKLTKEWIYTRLLAPQRVSPTTRESKHGWYKPNELSDVADDAIAVWLATALSSSARHKEGKPTLGDVKRGRDIYKAKQCVSCHGDLATGLAGIASKVTTSWLDAFLSDPRALSVLMPQIDMTSSERSDLVAALAAQRSPQMEAMWPRPSRALDEATAELQMRIGGDQAHVARELFELMGCSACHAGVTPYVSTAASLARTLDTRRITAQLGTPRAGHGQYAQVDHTLADIASWLGSDVMPDQGVLAWRQRGCGACHESGSAPKLEDVGERYRVDGLADFLQHPQPLRPSGPRMPAYAWSTEQLRATVGHLLLSDSATASIDVDVSTGPVAAGCQSCHDEQTRARFARLLRPKYLRQLLSNHPTPGDPATTEQRLRALQPKLWQ